MKMIYEPVTEFGKKIAGLLRFDDGVRLEIHDYLEEVESRLQEALEKAEKWVELQKMMPSKELLQKMEEYRVVEQKLEAIKSNLTHMVGILEMDFIHANTMIKIEYAKELLEILEGSEFTTNSEEEKE